MTMHYQNTYWLEKKVIIGKGELDPSQPVNLLLGFHGADSTPENMLVHGNKLTLENTIMIYPEGPVDGSDGLFSWWQDGPRQKETVTQFLDYTGQVVDEAHQYLKQEMENTPIQTCLWGFSQGAAASLVYTLFGRHSIHKIASICGFLPELPETSGQANQKTTILGIYGKNDDIVPPFLADYALDAMKNMGHDLTIKGTQQGHEIKSENIQDMTAFFNG